MSVNSSCNAGNSLFGKSPKWPNVEINRKKKEGMGEDELAIKMGVAAT